MANLEVMRQLRRVVENAPDELLHMRAVVEHSECGTARCAIGWAIVDPWFQQNTNLNDELPIDYNNRHFSTDSPVLLAIFGLSAQDSEILFGGNLGSSSPEHGVSKQQVLDNIDRVLNGEPLIHYKVDWSSPST